MNFQQQLLQLGKSGEKLLAAIENESWDSALGYSQEWGTCIQDMFNCLSSDQFVLYKDELLEIEQQHQDIKEKLIDFRAKTLTQLQDINKYRAFNKHYNDMD